MCNSYLGEKGGPDWLDVLDLGGSDQSLELLGLCNCQFIFLLQRALSQSASSIVGVAYSDIDTIIGEDQSGVGGGELGVRHFEDLYC